MSGSGHHAAGWSWSGAGGFEFALHFSSYTLYELRMNSDIGQVRVVFGVCVSLGEAQCSVEGLAWCLGMLKAWSKP